jgi:hypothetical protein
MNAILKKLAPTLMVLAVAGYCCWSDGEAGPPAKSKEASKPALAAALLTPAAAPAPERDPFYTGVGEVLDDKTAKKTAPPPLPKSRREPSPSARDELVKITSGLVLKATFVFAGRRVALINDRFYAEGDAIPFSKTLAVTIAQVEPNKVVLRHAGQTTEIKYPDRPTPAPPEAGRPANPRALAVAP